MQATQSWLIEFFTSTARGDVREVLKPARGFPFEAKSMVSTNRRQIEESPLSRTLARWRDSLALYGMSLGIIYKLTQRRLAATGEV